MRVLVHAYPWDVIGDPLFTARVQTLGAEGVNLAAAYHTVRAATPWHPERAYMDARHSALYRPVREEAWRGRRLVPAAPAWMEDADAFGTAARALAGAGVPVTAWIVLTHASRLGEAHPDVSVVNCFGEHYPWALCPSRAEVREYAATLAAEAVRDLPLAGALLEACGQLGADHGGHHDKTDGAYDARARRMLSVCCCAACRDGWEAGGADPGRTVRDLRAAVRSREHDLDAETAATILAVRHQAADELRHQVVAALPTGLRVALHASPDPWATGANPGLRPPAGKDVDAVIVQCWPTGQESADRLRVARRMLPEQVALGAYVTVLPPVRQEDLVPHVRRLAEAGAEEIHLYHAGLAGPARHGLLADAALAAAR
ncbi:hypothetical protein Sme01_10940 [Sphaerisporangium melleum]|uniref:Alanine-rich protein n=1 Tax=Sphaerisporangium melleum TaxID=321316 RepID=A0A917VDX2_9ACTN|nr:hypothetical protein [Sphaerisporangium melleum]GGK66322.1 hypothetical protein GCM10007964_06680 [Sphaerisporangium melleum]GII68618.1 hypothetical protein Sme01_10940 [Sphaerisporangium melleum]